MQKAARFRRERGPDDCEGDAVSHPRIIDREQDLYGSMCMQILGGMHATLAQGNFSLICPHKTGRTSSPCGREFHAQDARAPRVQSDGASAASRGWQSDEDPSPKHADRGNAQVREPIHPLGSRAPAGLRDHRRGGGGRPGPAPVLVLRT
jgi:hypothetical protein